MAKRTKTSKKRRNPLRALCGKVNNSFSHLIQQRVVVEQPDSRAFGAYVEKRIKDEWKSLCLEWGTIYRPHPGRRTIYDVSFEFRDQVVGLDIKSKDLDSTRYSDGGICAISNLLRFLVRENSTFLLSEFGYKIDTGDVSFAYVKTAPFQCLPFDIYRIENLGTGQIRLNYTIEEAWNKIEWDRTNEEFFKHFSQLCLAHYQRVAGDAKKRYKAIEAFIKSGFTEVKL
jgi:hypothetical protein